MEPLKKGDRVVLTSKIEEDGSCVGKDTTGTVVSGNADSIFIEVKLDTEYWHIQPQYLRKVSK